MKTQYVLLLIAIAGAIAGGWYAGSQFGGSQNNRAGDEPTTIPASNLEPDTLHGLGKLQPVSGVIRLIAAPGQRVEKLNVTHVGQEIKKDQILAVLQTKEIRELELAVAKAKQKEANDSFEFEKQLSEFKLQSAKLAVKDAGTTLSSVEAKAESSKLIQKRITLATDMLNRLTELKNNPATSQLVNQSDIDQQKLMVQQFNMQLDEAKIDINVARDRAKMAQEIAETNLKTALFSIDNAGAKMPTASIEQTIELAKLAVDSANVKSPIDGVVLDIIVSEGDAVANQPILIVGNTSQMMCEAEINDSQMKLVKKGLQVKLTSKALAEPLTGTVSEVGVMIGPPSLKDPNPYASVDRKTGKVLIKLDSTSSQLAKDLVNLQVDVEILLSPMTENE